MTRLHFQDAGQSGDGRRVLSAQDGATVTSPAAPCILLAGESPSLLSLRARILAAADMLCSMASATEAPGALLGSFHDAVVICHTVLAEDVEKIVHAACKGQRRTPTLLLTRIPHYVPPALSACHFDDLYCWYEGIPVFVSKLRRLVDLTDHHA